MTTDESVHMGLVGLGRMGRFHAANLAGRVPGARLVRVGDAAEGVAREISGRLVGVDWSTNYDDLIEAAAASGKHIFCEKPISLDLKRTYDVVEVARAASVRR